MENFEAKHRDTRVSGKTFFFSFSQESKTQRRKERGRMWLKFPHAASASSLSSQARRGVRAFAPRRCLVIDDVSISGNVSLPRAAPPPPPSSYQRLCLVFSSSSCFYQKKDDSVTKSYLFGERGELGGSDKRRWQKKNISATKKKESFYCDFSILRHLSFFQIGIGY